MVLQINSSLSGLVSQCGISGLAGCPLVDTTPSDVHLQSSVHATCTLQTCSCALETVLGIWCGMLFLPECTPCLGHFLSTLALDLNSALQLQQNQKLLPVKVKASVQYSHRMSVSVSIVDLCCVRRFLL